jgi:4-hydroxybenzoate polyprenyltransferase
MIGYLRLVRLPNVFTALADILAGYAIMRALYPEMDPGYGPLAILCGASASLYLAGMAFNDIADREEDAEVRPNRPIPSGQVSLKGALVCGGGLMALGVGLAYVAGTSSFLRAVMLAAAILQYDFNSKRNVQMGMFMGPLVLGVCRFLNVQLGLSVHPAFASIFETASLTSVPWAPSFAMGIYAAGLTAFSTQEEEGKKNIAILFGWLLCFGGILIAALTSSRVAWIALAPLALVLLFLTRKLRKEGTPEAARNLVRAGVMGVCVLDAGMILGFSASKDAYANALQDLWPWAAGCVALLVPGLVLGKWLRQKEA